MSSCPSIFFRQQHQVFFVYLLLGPPVLFYLVRLAVPFLSVILLM
ncbi:hypothetical protein E2C01_002521 [Portunus trituberculatus]|uniref:Uncharacterized protein n=1 Tax=Portunus trituberculatus TaxID=210409 RepID=A0A5B7CQY7_PORTR|nr:hypothetical protein [Portunus trituberculatus]